MIKKLLFVYFCLFGFSFQGFGQIKLTLDDLPEIGTKKIISYGQAPETAKAGEASATAQTWDFTALAPTSQEAIEFKNPIETPFYDEFPLSDMARSGPLTSLLGFSLPNFGQGDGAVGTAYYGINNATKSIFTIGLVTDINIGGFVDLEDVKIEGTPPDLYLTALEYGKSASSNAKFPFTIEVPGIPIPITVSLNIEREMTADAFGTIYLPTDTFEVLRIHDKSILKPKIDLLPDTIGSVETHRYIFIAKDEDYPVMTLTMSGSGADATIVNVEYVDLPAEPAVVDFDYSADCLSVDFINESSNAFNFSWDFGDGTTSLDYQPDYTYKNKGDYEVTLTATDLNGDTIKITKSISVNCVVDPDFNISDVNCLTISFNNQTNNGATYLWEFGDGGTSTDEDPTHTYNKPGDFTVTLTAYGVAVILPFTNKILRFYARQMPILTRKLLA
ncbi:MAG: PKD domain-containing protein [Sphingobacteriales bacterium]|nr:PKD domain-containing protein [Sphingobacteriales bacterium]